jgi:hypothetical protein
MALHHWFRSAEITTLLNRLCHSETYSFSLGTFGFLIIWGDNKVDVVSTAMAIEVSSSRENEYVSE